MLFWYTLVYIQIIQLLVSHHGGMIGRASPQSIHNEGGPYYKKHNSEYKISIAHLLKYIGSEHLQQVQSLTESLHIFKHISLMHLLAHNHFKNMIFFGTSLVTVYGLRPCYMGVLVPCAWCIDLATQAVPAWTVQAAADH